MKATEPTPPDRSQYPRPLGFHIMLSAMTWNGAVAGLPGFCKGQTLSHASLTVEGAELSDALSKAGPGILNAVTEGALSRIETMIQGVRAYHVHPYARAMTPPSALFQSGSLRLLDYGAGTGTTGDKPDQVVVAVPSLINPSHILDLGPDRSLMRYLARRGLRPLLVDWGTPGEAEKGFDVGDYIMNRLEGAVEQAAQLQGAPVPLIGYCMGGNLALGLTVRRPDLVSTLALLATPWDFHATSVIQSRAIATIFAGVLSSLTSGQTVPVDLIQLFFASIDPTLTDRKFRRFATLDPTGSAAELFVAIEDWNNGGAPLAAGVARECLRDWYGDNRTERGEWSVGDTVIDPAAITRPALVVAPRADRIVPPASALALGKHLPHVDVIRTRGGHVTMVVGPNSRTELWQPLADWLLNRAANA